MAKAAANIYKAKHGKRQAKTNSPTKSPKGWPVDIWSC
uniref:Uncharacterized protein n=1 Tax=Romanomermis culicivorax TaxID=13658 RepID=A0A915J6X8_ROMCU